MTELDRAYLPGGLRAPVAPADVPVGPPAGLAVLVVGYRRADLLDGCLRSVAAHLPGVAVRVWDNTAAPAPDLDAVVAAHPSVAWWRSDRNVGFAAAVNRLADDAGTDDLLLLNPDATLLAPPAATLAALREPDVAAAAPRLHDPAVGAAWDVAHRRAGVAGALVARSGYAPALRGRRLSPLYGAPPSTVTGYLTGACLAISRRAWTAIGPFDEEFFLYGEEADWQQRARGAGWRLVLADEAVVAHRSGGTVAGSGAAARRSEDLLEAGIALELEHRLGPRRAAAYLAGGAVLDRVQRSRRPARRAGARRGDRPAIVLTTNRLVFGGAERQRVLLATELDRRGYRVVIACLQRFGPLVADVPASVRVVRAPWWCPAIDHADGPAILVGGDTNTETGFASLWRAGGRDRRWLVAAHIPPSTSGPTYSHPLAAAIARADGFIALSPRHRQQATAFQSLGRRWFTAPNGVAPGATDVPPMREPGRPLRLVMVSRIVEHKNPHLLIDALADSADLPWQLSIWGDGPDRARLQALTPDHLRDRVRWRGWSPGPEQAMADADLVCLPSASEAFPLTVLEAHARGLPVIASGVCSVPDMLDGGRAGVVVAPVTRRAWASALRPLLADPSGLPALGRAGFEHMRAHYTIEAMADAYERAFAAVAPAGRG